MKNPFVTIYNSFTKRSYSFYISLIAIVGLITFFVSGIELEEDIKAIIPQDGRIDDISVVLDNSKFSDQIIVTLSDSDSANNNPDKLITNAEELVSLIQLDSLHIKNINFKTDESSFLTVYNFFYENLPLYLSEDDYQKMDSSFTEEAIESTLKKDFKSLISPAGLATKKYIFKDPFSITPLALEKLKYFKLDENFILNNACVFTKDKTKLLLFIEPSFPAGNIDENAQLIETIDNAIDSMKVAHPNTFIEYYGGTAVAVANAKRVKNDIMLTVNIVLVLIFIIFYLYFRRIRLILLLFLPVVLGAGLSISLISIISGSISAIALGVGAILVGISIDYSLHVFTHFKNSGSISATLRDVTGPLLMSSITTGSAFLCLFIIDSEALNQLGMFGAFSVMFAALLVLLIIPFLLSKLNKNNALVEAKNRLPILDKIASFPIEQKKPFVIGLIILSVIFGFFAGNIRFNSNIANLNYLPPHLAKAEKNLEQISSETMSAVYFATTANTLEEALIKAEKLNEKLTQKDISPLYTSKSSGVDLVLSIAEQEKRITRWNDFWDKHDRENLQKIIIEKGATLRFKENAFSQFYSLINKNFSPIPAEEFKPLQESFLSNYISSNDSIQTIVTILKVDRQNKAELFKHFENDENAIIFDKQYFSNKFFDVLRDDFDKLVTLSMLIVFGIILISFGRIELAIITMTPILLSWVWTLGLMSIFQIEFNIFNIIISTFIFGLGIDYSIFIMKGLLNKYKYGNHDIKPYKLSVLLSVITTILGVGALIFAKHPALKSIATVSIFGISSVMIISYTVLPLLFNYVVSKKQKARVEPITLFNLVISLIVFSVFIVDSIILTLLVPILKILPIKRKFARYIYHVIICKSSGFIVDIVLSIKKTYLDIDKIDFSKPSVLVANHQSFLDLVLLLRLHPKMIVITNKGVWFNPFYGVMVRFAEYFPVYKGIEKMDRIKRKVDEGYSILVFPEGTRTSDGKIKRFHQGAWKLADDFGLDIQPILIHGAHQCLRKAEFFMRSGFITIKALDKVSVKSIKPELNESYREQSKAVTTIMRDEFSRMQEQYEGTEFYRQHLINKFIFKGPVLEWYVKSKLILEGNYSFYNKQIPRDAKIVDLGCGYGFIPYMLSLCSNQREILAIDYDDEKIAIAKNTNPTNTQLSFSCENIAEYDIPKADAYLILDVLHYLPEELQKQVLDKCMKQLRSNGIIIIRDADADLLKRNKVAKNIEYNSTKILKFNKTEYNLTYISGQKIIDWANKNGFKCERLDKSKYTSNITYIIKK